MVDVKPGLTPEQFLKNDTELVSMAVTVDGKKWSVPPSLYNNVMNPTLRKDYFVIELSKDGKTLDVNLTGPKEDIERTVHWTFRSNGRHDFASGPGC
jgi:hypothetical protein